MNIPNLTSDETFFKISASSEFSSDYPAWHACNYDIATEWATNGQNVNCWLEYEHPCSIQVTSFAMVGRKNGECPRNDGD